MSFVTEPVRRDPVAADRWHLDNTYVDTMRAILTALAIVLVQILFLQIISLVSGADRARGLFDSFCRWDGNLYVQITERGYHGEPPGNPVNFQKSNVAFFPGYPLASRWLHDTFRGTLSFRAAMVLTAQLAAWGFWTYWLLFLARWGTPSRLCTLLTVVLTLHPAAFFLVVAYSESLFLAAMLGFLYWITSSSALRWPLAAAHGFVMTATRMGGVPVALAPLAAALLIDAVYVWPAVHESVYASATAPWRRLCCASKQFGQEFARQVAGDPSRVMSLAALALVAGMGVVSFFAYCQWQFGAWNLYMQIQKAGWNLSADWLWWLRPVNYVFMASAWHPNVVWPDDVSRFTVLATLTAFALIARFEVRLARTGDKGWQRRSLFYLAAAGLFFLHAAGVSPILMKSMIRYSFGVHVLLLLALAQLAIERQLPIALSRPQMRWLAFGLVLLGGLQTAIAWRFFSNEWVA
jgi:hypothetical protein